MKEIEEELYRIHAEIRAKKDAESGDGAMEVSPDTSPPVPQATPFVKVDRVDGGSPASSAVSFIS
jgi:hypothetical protein